MLDIDWPVFIRKSETSFLMSLDLKIIVKASCMPATSRTWNGSSIFFVVLLDERYCPQVPTAAGNHVFIIMAPHLVNAEHGSHYFVMQLLLDFV